LNHEITVIIPTFNRAALLPETIESVLMQGVSARILVIDDGSTDATSVLKARYERVVTWVTQNNRGEVRTVNRGMRAVDTPYFAIVNSDDPLLPGSLRTIIDALAAQPDALAAYCDWMTIDEQARQLGKVTVGLHSIDTMMLDIANSIGPGAVFRRRVLEDVGLRNPLLKYSADLDYWHRIALSGPVVYVPEVLATHRVHAESASISDRGARIAEEVAYLREAYAAHPRWSSEEGRRPALVARQHRATMAGHFAAAFAASRRRDAGRDFMRAFFLVPGRFLALMRHYGFGNVASAVEVMGGAASTDGRALLRVALAAPDRRCALRCLVRAALRDTVGVLQEAQVIGVTDVERIFRSMPARK
jgi:glycosyltransferase involved in cell wall biosynthesis